MNAIKSLTGSTIVASPMTPFLTRSLRSFFRRRDVAKFSTAPRLFDRRYTKTHEWISQTGGEEEKVGITTYAGDALGEIVYVQLPDIGTELTPGSECGAVESVKAATDLYSPASGIVTVINDELGKTPSHINSSPYEKGWIFKLKLSKSKELDQLMTEDEYKKFLEIEHPL